MNPKVRYLLGLDSLSLLCSKAREANVDSMISLSEFQRKLLDEPDLESIPQFPLGQLKKIVSHGLIIECLELGGVSNGIDDQPVISHSYLSLLAPRSLLGAFRGLAEAEEDCLKTYFMDAQTENEYRKLEKNKGGAPDMKLREATIVAQDGGQLYYNYAMLHFPAEPLELLGEVVCGEALANWVIIKMRYFQPLPRLQYLVACVEGALKTS